MSHSGRWGEGVRAEIEAAIEKGDSAVFKDSIGGTCYCVLHHDVSVVDVARLEVAVGARSFTT